MADIGSYNASSPGWFHFIFGNTLAHSAVYLTVSFKIKRVFTAVGTGLGQETLKRPVKAKVCVYWNISLKIKKPLAKVTTLWHLEAKSLLLPGTPPAFRLVNKMFWIDLPAHRWILSRLQMRLHSSIIKQLPASSPQPQPRVCSLLSVSNRV